MTPHLHEISSDHNLLVSLTKTVSCFDCSAYFPNHLGLAQYEQKKIIDEFQHALTDHLKNEFNDIEWQTEYSPEINIRDSIDIVGTVGDLFIVIELDKHRADQVSKKFLSRTAIMAGKKVIYISLCYPGTSRMNPNECVKYFSYCSTISKMIGNEYAGLIIQ
ncbi:hypothetical protein [Desulfogranum marinum]|uniref:hypothetical protein n=1 Tax=Desulfogranum marinum TaxID=453220 RepID=UPI001962BB1F|nr:hypothetical protein [Desulfogranum marinum]MBM9512017.1 hypothetical protein [Desulfogranum marinum]